MEFLGRRCEDEVRIYFSSGTSIVYWGIREKSLDIDIKVEGSGVGEIIRDAKEDLNVNIEPEHPGNFIPLPDSWRERSPFVNQIGSVQFFHLDPYAVAISKFSRSTQKDLEDVRGLVEAEKIKLDKLKEIFFSNDYQEKLKDVFSVDPEVIGERINELSSALD